MLVGKQKNAMEQIKDVSPMPLTTPEGFSPLSVVLVMCDCSLPCPLVAGKQNSLFWLMNCAAYDSVSQPVSIDLFFVGGGGKALQVPEESVNVLLPFTLHWQGQNSEAVYFFFFFPRTLNFLFCIGV